MSLSLASRLFLTPVLLLLLLITLQARGVNAQTAGELHVQITNGTPGGGAVQGLPLTIYRQTDANQETAGGGQTDARGAYTWTNLTGDVSALYVVSTTYKGVAYKTQPVNLPAPDVSLRVYEVGGDDARLRIANAGIVILQVDAEMQRIRFLETVTLHNGGDRTFVPSTDGPRGAMGLLRFSLPEGAGNLTVGEGLVDSEVIQIDRGFATNLPVSPGDTSVSFVYEMAYGALQDSGYAQITKDVPYPADSVQLLAVQGDFNVESQQLSNRGLANIGGRVYRKFEASNLSAHSEISVELRNLPLILPALRPGNAWLQVVIGGLALLALALPMLYRRFYLRQAGTRLRISE